MIDAVITWAVRHRLWCAVLAVMVAMLGLRALRTMPVDAIPDLSENQVIVFADWPGRGPQELEAQVTQPLSLGLQGLSGVKTIRASSMFGFSLLTVVFEDSVPSATARQRVLERLNLLALKLPAGVTPALGPEATGLGWVFEYFLAGNGAKSDSAPDLGELRALQDSFIGPQLNSVSGVAEVASVGGFIKQYQIELDSAKMRDAGVTVRAVLEAIAAGNLNVGGRTIEENGQEFVVRGTGVLRGPDDLEKIVVMAKHDAPIRLKDIARIEIGGGIRRGALDVSGREAVGGIVVMRTGENARDVIQRVKARIAQLQLSLPDGVTIESFYDRSELIDRSLASLQRTLLEEILLVVLVHIIFLWHFRSILIVTLPLPLSILASFACLAWLGITSNIMSLAGLAIAIGVLVDGAIVLTENALRRCEQAVWAKGGELTASERVAVVLAAARQVGRPTFYAMAVIILSFAPVFALSGREGKLFHPLALAKTFAMITAAVLSITLVPALITVFVQGPYPSEGRNPVMRALLRAYEPVLDFALHRPRWIIGFAGGLVAGALILAFGLPRPVRAQLAAWPRLEKLAGGMGSEFMPLLNEGSLLFMPTFVPATSFSEVKRIMAWQDRIFESFPEVRRAVGKLGRAETATDPAPVQMIETTITLKPENEWPPGMTQDRLINEVTEALKLVPGSVPGFLQPIQGRILMLSTGVRAQLGVKFFGDDPNELQHCAFEAEKIIHEVRGATGVTASRSQGKPYLEIEPERDALWRYGLQAQNVMDVVDVGIGGKEAGTVFEGRRRVPIQVRLQRSEREDIERLRDATLVSAGGQVYPLGQVAIIRRTEGPDEIASENGRLRTTVQANVDSQMRDLGSFVEEVKGRLAHDLQPRLAKGITMEFSGEYENELHARDSLLWMLPAVLLLMFGLLHRVYRRIEDTAHVLLAVPFALSGGVFLQFALGIPFSVAVWIGYLALFGTAVQTAMIMIVYLDEAVEKARSERGPAFQLADLIRAAKDGARLRLRPKIMTVATIVASLLPVLWSTRTGAEVVRPIAVPVIGGMLSSLVHVLVVTPVIFVWLRSRSLKEADRTDLEPATPSLSLSLNSDA